MKIEAQITAIANIMGFSNPRPHEYWGWDRPIGELNGATEFIPDYLRESQLAIEAVKNLEVGDRYSFGWQLSEVLGFKGLDDVDNLGYRFTDALTSTPLQIWEAYLKLKGRWIE